MSDKKAEVNSNLTIYDQVKSVPQDATKPISGGRTVGLTDIKPMWRIFKLTELFGVCGFGWKYVITSQRLEPGADGIISAFVDINLFVKMGEQWSEAIPGIGGNSFVAKERGGLYTSDECYKMALTDAISVACKALGIGADIYMGDANKDSKYDKAPQNQNQQQKPPQQKPPYQQKPAQEQPEGMATDKQLKMIFALSKKLESLGKPKTYVKDAMKQLTGAERSEELTKDDAKSLIEWALGIEEDMKNKTNDGEPF